MFFAAAAVAVMAAIVLSTSVVLAAVCIGAAAVFLVAAFVVRQRAPRALIVGAPDLRGLVSVSNALDHSRYATGRCLGPELNDCPALRGEACPYRGYSAVVVVEHGDVTPPCGEAMGGIPELRIPRRLLTDPLASVVALKAVRAMPDKTTADKILTSTR
ncbi:MAG TPA: hypothetical protein VHN98_02275 [Acidimicrobiales bacterium]|nr:hypothetical protein [Acidimicrobiales bacterium]